MSKKIITYCAGGLANRIRPLVSHIAMAKEMNREHYYIWKRNRVIDIEAESVFSHPDTKRLACLSSKELKDTSLFAKERSLSNELSNGSEIINELVSEGCAHELDYEDIRACDKDTIIILDNEPSPGVRCRYLEELQKISFKASCSCVDKVIPGSIGLHLRLTDFRPAGVDERYYSKTLHKILNSPLAKKKIYRKSQLI